MVAVTRALGFVAALALPAAAVAQAGGHPASAAWDGLWYTEWGPLRPIADLPRERPGDQVALPAPFAPAPDVGLFWTGGNPGAIAFDVRRGYAEFEALSVTESGSYRRPLAPERSENRGAAGVGWTRLGERGAAVGGAVAGQQVLDPASPALTAFPFSSTPLVLADTSAPGMEHLYARLEGASGARIGDWGLGLAAGYQVAESGGFATPIPRIARLAEPALAAGIARVLGPLELGVYGRWRATALSTQVLSPRTGSTHVFPFFGYAEPVPIQILQSTYYRRMDREARALGGGGAGELGGVRWAAYGEATSLDEEQTSDRQVEQKLDRWSATGVAYGGAAQARVLGALVTVTLRAASLSGQATRHDIEETVFDADETVRTGSVEARLPRVGPWDLAVTLALAHEHRRRRDGIARTRSDIEALVPGAIAHVARRITDRFDAAVVYGFRAYAVRAGIPEGGPMYSRLLWPDMLLQATPARSHGVRGALRYTTAGNVTFLARLEWSTLGPGSTERSFAELPDGSRNTLRVSFGARMAGPEPD